MALRAVCGKAFSSTRLTMNLNCQMLLGLENLSWEKRDSIAKSDPITTSQCPPRDRILASGILFSTTLIKCKAIQYFNLYLLDLGKKPQLYQKFLISRFLVVALLTH